jgi:Ca2+-binding EF-hand superfamily protein
LNIDDIQQIALQWMELADRDGNGQLDFAEFSEFFSKLEGIIVSDEEIEKMFKEFDMTGNGMISIEEFARAIYLVTGLAEKDV